jgi:hypothetical protein
MPDNYSERRKAGLEFATRNSDQWSSMLRQAQHRPSLRSAEQCGPDATVRARSRSSAPHAQRGLGLFGTLLIVAVAAAALYYVYLGVTGEGEEPSCRNTYNACQQNCRRTRTETVALQDCQDFCRRELAQCERRSP